MSSSSFITMENLEAFALVLARKIASVSDGANVVIEKHVLTAGELDQGYFELGHSVVVGHESEVLLFVGGVAQVAGVDFVANGNRISWSEKGLDEIELVAGDILVVQYKS